MYVGSAATSVGSGVGVPVAVAVGGREVGVPVGGSAVGVAVSAASVASAVGDAGVVAVVVGCAATDVGTWVGVEVSSTVSSLARHPARSRTPTASSTPRVIRRATRHLPFAAIQPIFSRHGCRSTIEPQSRSQTEYTPSGTGITVD